tara:strand:+ start:90 stop:857 length:768 start_codon:yes stop_codon:yes gene_type:complete
MSVKNNIWKHILKINNFIKGKSIIITANDIKKCKNTWIGKKNQFEPRLLCSQNTNKLDIFIENNISILPIKNGTYLISDSNIYCNLFYNNNKIIKINNNNDEILLTLGNSEQTKLDYLRYTDVFENYYIKEKIKYDKLLTSRHRLTMKMILNKKKLNIESVQIEIDGCYVSDNNIILIEMKNNKKNIDFFNIRQLYYPYRYVYDFLQNNHIKKNIICLFIHYINNKYHIRWYKFKKYNIFDSIYLHDYRVFEIIK